MRVPSCPGSGASHNGFFFFSGVGFGSEICLAWTWSSQFKVVIFEVIVRLLF